MLPAAVVTGLAVGASVVAIDADVLTAVHRVEQIEQDVHKVEAIPGTIEHAVAAKAAKVKAARHRIVARLRYSSAAKFLYDAPHTAAQEVRIAAAVDRHEPAPVKHPWRPFYLAFGFLVMGLLFVVWLVFVD